MKCYTFHLLKRDPSVSLCFSFLSVRAFFLVSSDELSTKQFHFGWGHGHFRRAGNSVTRCPQRLCFSGHQFLRKIWCLSTGEWSRFPLFWKCLVSLRLILKIFRVTMFSTWKYFCTLSKMCIWDGSWIYPTDPPLPSSFDLKPQLLYIILPQF